MTANEALSWMVPIAAGAAVICGLLIVALCIRHMMAAVTAMVCIGLLIGLIFITSPKWTELTLEMQGFKATIAELEDQSNKLSAKAAAFDAQVAVLQNLGQEQPLTAQDLVASVGQARKQVDWATFLPSTTANYGVLVTSKTADAETQDLAEKLGLNKDQLIESLNSSGFMLVAPATGFDLSQIPARDVVISPFAVEPK